MHVTPLSWIAVALFGLGSALAAASVYGAVKAPIDDPEFTRVWRRGLAIAGALAGAGVLLGLTEALG